MSLTCPRVATKESSRDHPVVLKCLLLLQPASRRRRVCGRADQDHPPQAVDAVLVKRDEAEEVDWAHPGHELVREVHQGHHRVQVRARRRREVDLVERRRLGVPLERFEPVLLRRRSHGEAVGRRRALDVRTEVGGDVRGVLRAMALCAACRPGPRYEGCDVCVDMVEGSEQAAADGVPCAEGTEPTEVLDRHGETRCWVTRGFGGPFHSLWLRFLGQYLADDVCAPHSWHFVILS
jgi:hypothetical protein